MKDELGAKIMAKFFGLRAKTYSYLIGDSSEDKKPKGTRKCVIKRKCNFENYKNCFEANEVDNKINYLAKNKIDIESIKKIRKIKNHELILKVQQRFKSERHNVLLKHLISLNALSSNYDKRMQSINSIETYAYETSKDLVNEEEEIKCNNIIKRYKK